MGDIEDRLLTPAEVGMLFRVDPKTVTRWGAAGRFGTNLVRTPGGHIRIQESKVREKLKEGGVLDDAQISKLVDAVLRKSGIPSARRK